MAYISYNKLWESEFDGIVYFTKLFLEKKYSHKYKNN